MIGLTGVSNSLPPQLPGILRFLGIAAAGLLLGNLTGRILRLQRRLDTWGGSLSRRLPGSEEASPGLAGALSAGVLLALNPLLIPAAIQDGLAHRWLGLALKAALDAVALHAWSRSLSPHFRSWSLSLMMLAPPLLWQACWTVGASALVDRLQSQGLIDPLMMATSLLILCCVPAIAGVRRASLANLLPTLGWIPALDFWIRA